MPYFCDARNPQDLINAIFFNLKHFFNFKLYKYNYNYGHNAVI